MQIKLDKDRNLRFNTRSFALLEEKLGQPGQDRGDFLSYFVGLFVRTNDDGTFKNGADGKPLGKSPLFSTIEAVLWASLRHEDPTLTLEQASDLITPENFGEVEIACVSVVSEWIGRFPNKRPLSQGSLTENGGPSADTTSASIN